MHVTILTRPTRSPPVRGNWSTGFLDYILPQTPGGFRRFLQQNRLPVGFRGKQFAPVDFRRKPEPVPRTQVLSYLGGDPGPRPDPHFSSGLMAGSFVFKLG